jgi:hypothetical protein
MNTICFPYSFVYEQQQQCRNVTAGSLGNANALIVLSRAVIRLDKPASYGTNSQVLRLLHRAPVRI